MLWAPTGVADDADSHVAFRGSFVSTSPGVDLRLLGASEFLVWIDGKLIGDGPARFDAKYPEYQTYPLHLQPGRHLIALHVHNEGVTTRILAKMAPFVWCDVAEGDGHDPVAWKCERISGYSSRTQRISDILGWIDWCDTRKMPTDWQQPEFDDSTWVSPTVTQTALGAVRSANTHPVRLTEIPIKPIAEGKLTENFGYERDDPAVKFFLRDLDPHGVTPQGVWRRYDLGRVRLGRPDLTIDAPAGAVIEYALCEELRHGRVHPFITLSGSRSCNFDHFVARGGPQEFMPFTPKGGRYLEVHVLTPGTVKFVHEEFQDRGYYGEPEGSFTCSDPLLNQIWQVGVNTLRACADDGFTDCPTRERGQWTGDVVSVATDICASAYGDLSLPRRALVQAAQSARSDGLVAGVGPGDPSYLSTYAAQWVTACVHYWQLTGDRTILTELEPAAERNLAAFRARTSAVGVSDDLGWGFVDWGYVRNGGPSDIALDIHYFMALRSMATWCIELGDATKARDYEAQFDRIGAIVRSWLAGKSWPEIGYQRAALALLAQLIPANRKSECIGFIESHLKQCFPNDPSAPRLSDPGESGDRFMTPYFCHFAFTALLNNGESKFVLNQYRKCWGWALGGGKTTWLEVFDTRWSQCHEWSGCPTWQLSKYVLGLSRAHGDGTDNYGLDIHPGDLKWASGKMPLPGGGEVSVSWRREGKDLRTIVSAPREIRLRVADRVIRTARWEGVVKPAS
jgi:hypothetical protein